MSSDSSVEFKYIIKVLLRMFRYIDFLKRVNLCSSENLLLDNKVKVIRFIVLK